MRRALPGIVPAAFLVLASFAARADDDEGNAAPRLDGEVKELINRIDPARIHKTIQQLANFGTRNTCSTLLAPDPGRNNGTEGILASQDFIFQQFSAIKRLRVAFAPFVIPERIGNTRVCPCAQACADVLTRNVVAWLPGKRHPERLIVIGGHLDSRSFGAVDTNTDTSALLATVKAAAGTQVTENAPAGDDAGAQTTVVLEAAHALAHAEFDNTLVFISFTGEEQGLFGSADVAVPGRLAQITGIPNATVVAMLNNDISGGDTLANTGDDFSAFRLYATGTPRERTSTAEDGTSDNTSPSRGLMRFIKTFGVPFVPGFDMRLFLREDRPGRASDQASFIANSVPAVRFIESHECSSSPVDNSCEARGDPLVAGRPCPSPFAALPRTDLRHNCLHTNFGGLIAVNDTTRPGKLVAVPVLNTPRVCANPDEREHGIVVTAADVCPDPAVCTVTATFPLNKTLFEGCVDDNTSPRSPNPFHNFQRQHAPNDRPEFPNADYEAKIAKVMSATLASLARAPNAPVNFTATGNATTGVTVTFAAAPGDKVGKFIVAARATTENFYRARVRVEGTSAFVTAKQLKMAPGESFFISVAAQGEGHRESLFAYPEFRCDASACAIPAGALNITASK